MRHPPSDPGRAVHRARMTGSDLVVVIGEDHPPCRQERERASRYVRGVEPAKAVALEDLDGRELRSELGSLRGRHGGAQIPEAAVQRSGRVDQEDRHRQGERPPRVGQRGQKPSQERGQRRVEGQEVVRVVVVEATPVLRRHRNAHVGAREDDEGQGGRPRRCGDAANGAQGGNRRRQVERSERQGEPRANQAAAQDLRDPGHDRPGGIAEEAEMGQHGLDPHPWARWRQRRTVRHAVEPVRQAAEGEWRQRGEKTGHQGPESPAQEQDGHRREIDEGEEVGPEGQPERAAQQGKEERRPAGRRDGSPQREKEREGPEHGRERVVAAGLMRPKQGEVRRDRQQDDREQRGPGPEGVVRQPHRQRDAGKREQHRHQLQRPGGDPEQPVDRGCEIAVQRAHERLAEEVDGKLALQHRQAQQARRRLVVPEARQPQEQEPHERGHAEGDENPPDPDGQPGRGRRSRATRPPPLGHGVPGPADEGGGSGP